ncbi:recombinase family protein [Streptomyces sp. NBC_00885]|uniref:recombinase family protein n=1 Tax=Streptomyces sp. NBC_00885 TaxID=2975857 RepID=UPI00386EAFF0|nr:recombinase family protein [Streptomyces sp. NBC_00885]
MTRYVALYCRISKDKRGRREGVEAQEKWGRAYAAHTWPGLPVKVFADSDISAAGDAHRPEYERLRESLARGEIAHLWAVEQSRLERREVEWFRLAAELNAAGITELHTNRDGIVRVRDVVAGIKAVLNADEVRTLKKRINDTLDSRAADGRPPGSTPFGYRHAQDGEGGKTYVVVPEEAEAIQWAAARVLDGWSLANIARELRAKPRGLTGPHRMKVRDELGEVVTDVSGNPVTRPSKLTAGSVRNMVSKPTVAGYRVHRGRVVGRGNWEPILDEATWQACRTKLAAPRVVTTSDGSTYPVTANHTGSTGRKYTLTGGLAVCGECAAPMTGSLKRLKNGVRKPYLLCHPNRGGRGCVGIMLDETEQHVADALFDELDRPEFLDALGADDHAQRRDKLTAALSAVDADRAELAEEWGAGTLSGEEWRAARRGLAEREDQLRADLAGVPAPVGSLDITRARASWPIMTLDERRELLRMFIAKVTIERAKPGTRAFDAGRVVIEWRQQ